MEEMGDEVDIPTLRDTLMEDYKLTLTQVKGIIEWCMAF